MSTIIYIHYYLYYLQVHSMIIYLFSPICPVPTGPSHSYYDIIDCISYAVLYIPVTVFKRQFYFLIPSLFNPAPQPHSSLTAVRSSLYLWVGFCLFVYIVLKVPHVGDPMHLSLSDWLVTLSTISSMSALALGGNKEPLSKANLLLYPSISVLEASATISMY